MESSHLVPIVYPLNPSTPFRQIIRFRWDLVIGQADQVESRIRIS
jgi:hypothetical protein